MAYLTLEQRYKIETYRDAGKSIVEIADYVGRDKSVVSRDIKRNSDRRNGLYRAKLADRKASQRHRCKYKLCRLNAGVEVNILYYLSMDFSPEQAVSKAILNGREMVSTESVYQYV